MTIKKSIAPVAGQLGDMGDLKGKGYVEMDRKGDRNLYTNNLP